MRRKLITAILWVIFIVGLSAPPLYAYRANNIKVAINIANVVRDTQLLLSLSGFYAGPLDGQCNTLTQEAIEKYINKTAGVTTDNSPDILCSVESLYIVKNGLSLVLTTGTSTSQKVMAPRASDINDKFSAEFDEINASITKTNSALKGITDGFAANFINQYNGLASTGMTIFITGISVTIAVIALVSNILRDVIAKNTEASHKKFLEESNTMLVRAQAAILDQSNTTLEQAKVTILQQAKEDSKTMLVAQAVLSTRLYGTLGGQIVYFYQDLEQPSGRKKNIYTTYLTIGARISEYGYQFGNRLIQIYAQQKTEIPDEDKLYINICRNNFVFYVSSANDKYFQVERNEDDIKNVRIAITELEKIADEDNEDNQNIYMRDLKDTIVWAKLSLGIMSAQQAKTEIELLTKDRDITQRWKIDLKKRYDFYDRFPEHEDKVNLQV